MRESTSNIDVTNTMGGGYGPNFIYMKYMEINRTSEDYGCIRNVCCDVLRK